MNKKLVIAIIIIIQLCFIWQCVLVPMSREIPEEEVVEEEQDEPVGIEDTENPEVLDEKEQETKLTSLDLINDFDQIVLEGQMEVNDTPWNTNMGLITLEEGGQCLLLLPNTGMMTPYLSLTKGKIEMSFCIFKDVRDKSDGAGLLLQIHDESGNLLKEENIPVDAAQEWQDYSCDISDLGVENIRVRIMCNNGGNDDDICDWVMLRKAIISSKEE